MTKHLNQTPFPELVQCPHCKGNPKINEACCISFVKWGYRIPTVYKQGTMAYWNTFAGLIKVKVEQINRRGQDNIFLVRVTGQNQKTYHHGEILELFREDDDLIPRKAYHRTGWFTFYTDPYKWEAG